MTDELEQKIAKWIDESGRALEMRVARAFYDAMFDVSPGERYRDGETLREIDVLARRRVTRHGEGATVMLAPVVECKGSAKRPWVVFTKHESYDRDAVRYGVVDKDVAGTLAELSERWVSYPPYDYDRSRIGFAVVDAVLDKTKNDDEDVNRAHNAVRQVLSAAYGTLRRAGGATTLTPLVLAIPVIVTKAPIVEAALQRDGSIRTMRQECSVLWVRPEQEDAVLVTLFLMSERHLRDVFAPALAALAEKGLW